MSRVRRINSSSTEGRVRKLNYQAAYEEFAAAIIEYVRPVIHGRIKYRIFNTGTNLNRPVVKLEFTITSDQGTELEVIIPVTYSEAGLQIAASELIEKWEGWDEEESMLSSVDSSKSSKPRVLNSSVNKAASDKLTKEERRIILDIFKKENTEVVRTYDAQDTDDEGNVLNLFVVEAENSNATYVGYLQSKLNELEDTYDIGFEVEANDNGFYGKDYQFYHYVD